MEQKLYFIRQIILDKVYIKVKNQEFSDKKTNCWILSKMI